MGLDGFHFLILHNDNSDQRGWFPGSQRTGVEVTKRRNKISRGNDVCHDRNFLLNAPSPKKLMFRFVFD